MRPIDADQILSAANSEEKLIGKDWDYDALKTSIELAPTLDVVSVVSVVRCKDCIRAMPYKRNPESEYILRCQLWGFATVESDTFCSYGRREYVINTDKSVI